MKIKSFLNLKLGSRMIFWISITSLVVMVGVGYTIFSGSSMLLKAEIKRGLEKEAVSASNQLEIVFSRISQISKDITLMDSTLLGQPSHTGRLRGAETTILQNDPDVLDIYTAYEEGAVDGKNNLIIGQMYDSERSKISPIMVNFAGEMGYDPNQPTYEYHTDMNWYGLVKEKQACTWGPPYFDTGGTNQYIVSMVCPIYLDSVFMGVGGTDLILDRLNSTIASIHIGQTGYGFLIGPSGEYLADPAAPERVTQQETIFSIADQTKNEDLREIGNAMIAGQSGFLEIKDPSSGKLNWIYYEPVESTGWSLAVTVPADEMLAGMTDLMLYAIIAGLVGFLLMAGLAYLLGRSVTKPIQVINAAVKNLAVGDFNRDMPAATKNMITRRGDEVGEMGRSLIGAEEYVAEMVDIANRIAYGDLTVNITPKSKKDELGVAYVNMIGGMRRMVSHVADNVTHLNQASEKLSLAARQTSEATSQIANVIQQVAVGINQQVESTFKTSTRVGEMTTTINTVTAGAQKQAEAVENTTHLVNRLTSLIQESTEAAQNNAQGSAAAAQNSKTGAATVQTSISSINKIREKVGFSAGKVKNMGEHSARIGAIVEIIDDIASQTNLLALNAAIEAARAGEHGKGFAVVADEVRKLAERSSAATKEINSLVRDIQRTVADAILTMDEAIQQVDEGVDRSQASGKALEEILRTVEKVYQEASDSAVRLQQATSSMTDMVTTVDTVAEIVEENTTSMMLMADHANDVTHSVEDISSISEESSASIEEVSASTEEMNAQADEVRLSAQSLAKLAQSLKETVAQFKLA
jgi:methyl-accepting chemotaxis protein